MPDIPAFRGPKQEDRVQGETKLPYLKKTKPSKQTKTALPTGLSKYLEVFLK
jgi:hypothetical protein